MKFLKKNKGFTMVELIIVIAIIAILAAVIAPQYLRFVESARESNDLQVASTLVEATTVMIASTNVDIPADANVVIRWDTSTNSYGRGPGKGAITVEDRNTFEQKPWMIELQNELYELLGFDSDATSIGEPQSAITREQDLLFRINPVTGQAELHTSYEKVWKTGLGLDIDVVSF